MYQFTKNGRQYIKMYEQETVADDFGGYKESSENLFYEGYADVVIMRDSPMMPEGVPDEVDGMINFNKHDDSLNMDKVKTGVRVNVDGNDYEVKAPADSFSMVYLRDVN